MGGIGRPWVEGDHPMPVLSRPGPILVPFPHPCPPLPTCLFLLCPSPTLPCPAHLAKAPPPSLPHPSPYLPGPTHLTKAPPPFLPSPSPSLPGPAHCTKPLPPSLHSAPISLPHLAHHTKALPLSLPSPTPTLLGPTPGLLCISLAPPLPCLAQPTSPGPSRSWIHPSHLASSLFLPSPTPSPIGLTLVHSFPV